MTGAEQSVARLVELTEAAAYADMLRAAPAAWQCREQRTPAGRQLLAPGFDILLFNRTAGFRLASQRRNYMPPKAAS